MSETPSVPIETDVPAEPAEAVEPEDEESAHDENVEDGGGPV